MIIKPVKTITNNHEGIVVHNKMRMKHIQGNLESYIKTGMLFATLEKELKNKNEDGVRVLVQEKLFFEEIQNGFEIELIETYAAHNDKDRFIEDLQKSYIKRGVKGFNSAWTPIIFEGR